MRYSADFKLSVDGKDINLLFNSWTFRNYSDRAGVDLDGLLQHLLANRTKLPDLLYAAAESYAKFNNEAFGHTELDAYLWMDGIGGYNSTQIINIWKVCIARLYNTTPEQVEAIFNQMTAEPEQDKKKEIRGAGKSSTRKLIKQD